MNQQDTWTLVLIAGGVFAVAYCYRCQNASYMQQRYGCYQPQSSYAVSTSASYPAPGYS